VLSIIPVHLPLADLAISDQLLQFGIWTYLLVFVIIMLASTIVGGLIPDNTFLFLTGAIAMVNGMSMGWLFVVAVVGGFAGYEINYWSGRLFGIAILRRISPTVLHDPKVRKALDMMEGFGLATLILSRFMPVMNLPSFIAGMDAMEYRRYVGFNLMSSMVWCGTLLILGYYSGGIPIINEYLGYLTYLFIPIMVIAIIIALVVFTRDYLK
jgi:membrane-associated protein